ncbi:hypothetical protein [Oleiagrimonas sp. C23AA]|uniref:hypothetical protein n=1 Tax=Oleiagrimonas sp. C23AA TaxID=2719047 RepID=UPI001420AA85|nr:hypothetical protein [Oleiagrimonas sp. C23AA]NII09109.1 hypothetical protein [Oleiagrimonas sp. C23AA]
MISRYIRCAAMAVVSVAVVRPVYAGRSVTPPLSPVQIIAQVRARAPATVIGRFEFTVRSVGHKRGTLFIDSMTDYRDPENVTLTLRRQQAQAVRQALHLSSDQMLIGQTLLIDGWARRKRIEFVNSPGHTPQGRHYFQTWLYVHGPDDIHIAPR